MIFGGEALRSITDTRSSDTIRSGFCGSILVAAVTSTKLSSGAIQIDVGTPTTLVGALTVATTFGGYWPTSMIDTVSDGGFFAGPTTPSTFALWASFAVTARSAKAGNAEATNATANAPTAIPTLGQTVILLPGSPDQQSYCRLGNAASARAPKKDARRSQPSLISALDPTHGQAGSHSVAESATTSHDRLSAL